MQSASAEMMFGAAEVLVAERHLRGLPGVRLRPQPRIRYTQSMFRSHQIIRANGALSESFFLARQSLKGMDRGQRRELMALFRSEIGRLKSFGATAALTLRASDAGLLRAALKSGGDAYGSVSLTNG